MAIDFGRAGDFDDCSDIVVIVPQGQRVRIRVTTEPSMDVAVVEYTEDVLVIFSLVNGDLPEFDDGQVHVVFEETYSKTTATDVKEQEDGAEEIVEDDHSDLE